MSLAVPARDRRGRDSALDDRARAGEPLRGCSHDLLSEPPCAQRHRQDRRDAAPAGAARRRLAERQADSEELVTGPPISAAFKTGSRRRRARFRAARWAWTLGALETHRRRRASTRVPEEDRRPRHPRHSCRSAAGADPQDSVAQDDVLDRQRRPALHPADSLAGGAARRLRWCRSRSRASQSGDASFGHRQLGADERSPVTIGEITRAGCARTA